MSDQDLRDLFSRLEQPAEPNPEFVHDLLRRVDEVLAGSSGQARDGRPPYIDDVRELTMHDSQSPTTRRWLVPVLGAVAAAAVVVAGVAIASDDEPQLATAGTGTTETSAAVADDPIAGYAQQVAAAYLPFYRAVNGYFVACHIGVTNADLSECETAIDATRDAITVFQSALGELDPPSALAADQEQLLQTATLIVDVLDRSAAPAAADDRAALREVNGSYGTSYAGWCDAIAHFNSLTPDRAHLRADLASTCSSG